MSTRYQQGRQAEYAVQRELAAEGYTTIRAAGSKGKTDILAWNGNHYRHIQVKTFAKRPGDYSDDLAALSSFPAPYNATRELWIKQRGQRGWFQKLVLSGESKQ